MDFLDSNGLEKLWDKIKEYVKANAGGSSSTANKLATARAIEGVLFDGSAARHHYGTCSTAGATAAKTCTIQDFSLVTGARVIVRFSYLNTAANPTLNVSSKGAKPIYYRGGAIPENYIAAGSVLEFVYSGSYWYVVGDLTQYLVSPVISPVMLYSSTAGVCASAVATWKYTNISGLSAWREVRIVIVIGDVTKGYHTFTRDLDTITVPGAGIAGYYGCANIKCDFTNNRVGIYVTRIVNWDITAIKILRIEGVVRN